MIPRDNFEMREDFYREFKLGAWIHRLGLTQKEVAKAAGIGEPYLSQLLSDPDKHNHMRWRVQRRLAHAIGLDNPNDLYIDPPPVDLTAAELALIARLKR